MKKSFFFLLITLSFFSALGQNLVPNPSFEDTVFCPVGLSTPGSIMGWYSPTTASPDHFHSCNNSSLGVPQNAFGWQNARTGNAYIGGHTSNFNSTDYREYLQCKLKSPLIAGELYEVSFFVSRADSSTKACDNVGIYLSSTPISSSNNQNLAVVPQVVSQINNPIVEAANWFQIIDTITAIGGEEYLTMGVFTNNVNTFWIPVNGGWEDEAHYYYDDVSVKKVPSCNEYGIKYPNVFTPNGDGKNDFWYPDGNLSELDAIYVLNRWGITVVELSEKNGFNWDGKDKNNKDVCSGVYYIVEDREGCPLKNVGFVHLMK